MGQSENIVAASPQEHANMHGYALMDPAVQKQLADLGKSLNAVAQVFLGLNERIQTLEGIVQNLITVTGAEGRTIQLAVCSRAREYCDNAHVSYKLAGRKVRTAIWHDIKDEFSISNYHDIPKKSFQFALEYIRGWRSYAITKKLHQLYAESDSNG